MQQVYALIVLENQQRKPGRESPDKNSKAGSSNARHDPMLLEMGNETRNENGMRTGFAYKKRGERKTTKLKVKSF